MNKRIKRIIWGFIIVYIFFMICSSKVWARTIDTNIDGIDDALYPRYQRAN